MITNNTWVATGVAGDDMDQRSQRRSKSLIAGRCSLFLLVVLAGCYALEGEAFTLVVAFGMTLGLVAATLARISYQSIRSSLRALLVLPFLFAASWLWTTWPDRTFATFAETMRQGQYDDAVAMIDVQHNCSLLVSDEYVSLRHDRGGRWIATNPKTHFDGWIRQHRKLSDWIQGKSIYRMGSYELVVERGRMSLSYRETPSPSPRWQFARRARVSVNPFSSGVPGYPNWSAFTGIRWQEDRPSVEIEGKWYELLKLNGVAVDEIRRACAKNGWPFQRRFTEDLVQLMRLMGHDMERTADLELRDGQGTIVTLKSVEMTEANRWQLLRSRYQSFK